MDSSSEPADPDETEPTPADVEEPGAADGESTVPVGEETEPPVGDDPGTLVEAETVSGGRPPIRIGAVVAVALAAAFIVWLLVRDDGSSTAGETVTTVTAAATTTPSGSGTSPIAISGAELARIATSGTTVYWAGAPEVGTTLTLLKSSNGSIYVRYLPPEVDVTDPIPPSLVVATYPLVGALAAVKRAAKEPDAVSIPLEKGGIAVYSKSKPTNIYFAYPKAPEQIEVYDPSPGRALQLVTSGTVVPVAR